MNATKTSLNATLFISIKTTILRSEESVAKATRLAREDTATRVTRWERAYVPSRLRTCARVRSRHPHGTSGSNSSGGRGSIFLQDYHSGPPAPRQVKTRDVTWSRRCRSSPGGNLLRIYRRRSRKKRSKTDSPRPLVNTGDISRAVKSAETLLKRSVYWGVILR